MASLFLAITVSLGAMPCAAMLPAADGNGLQCHVHSLHIRAMHRSMASGCCPWHTISERGWPSHPVMFVAPVSPPDCCVSEQPVRPYTFLVSSHTSVAPITEAKQFAGPEAAPTTLAIALAESPAFGKSVFDLKTDLRI